VRENVRQEIQSLLGIAQQLERDELLKFLGEIEVVRCAALAHLCTPAVMRPPEPDQLLSIEEAARRLKVSRDYLYSHKTELPFMRRMGRRVLFSSLGIDQYIGQNDGLTARRRRANLVAL
jgi:excisionase family DNA binding protein